ncbi:serine/threonine protein kinase [candidate division KSB3 bacterium]|uniref:Serine/threonine protein kinase n=1 Tax=candidate division KSB3 bacterium TaxID=2044937 RepID=A0A2G6KEP8_9BACT|nr:MAG: serine/threonine protein kinase [candidate division KSB3 bacterium]
MSKDSTTIVIQAPGQMHFLHRIRDFVAGVAEESGINEHDIDNIELAVDEACANVIEHGYDPEETEKNLTIRMEIDTSKLTLSIIDQGKHFDLRSRQQPDITELIDMKRDGGLGISLIKRAMDEIDYRKTADGYNELVLTKYLKKA